MNNEIIKAAGCMAMLFTATAVANPWNTQVDRAEDGSFYVDVKSTNVEQEFVLYADPTNECRTMGMLLEVDYHNGKYYPDSAPIYVQLRVDDEQIWSSETTASIKTDSRYVTFIVSFHVNMELLGQIAEGNKMIMRSKFDLSDDWGETWRYSLRRSDRAINNLMRICHSNKSNEWGRGDSNEWGA